MSVDQNKRLHQKNHVDLNRNQTTLRRTKDAVADRGVVVVDGKERLESLETPIFSHNSCNRIVAGTSLVARKIMNKHGGMLSIPMGHKWEITPAAMYLWHFNASIS